MGRFAFAAQCLARSVLSDDRRCTYCQSPRTRLIERKHVIVQLRRCDDCGLLFRWPKDSAIDNRKFYQSDYRESVVSELPAPDQLADLLAGNFAGTLLDYKDRIAAVRSVCAKGRLLDYGSSWGYGVHQFRLAGYDASGFEISAPRADFGRQALGVDISSRATSYPDHLFDVIHSAHVLEHIPDLRTVFADFRRLLKPDGVLVLSFPNGGGASARRYGVKWGPMIGEKHVNALTAEFLAPALEDHGFAALFGSWPYDSPPRALGDSPFLDGDELLVIARPIAAGAACGKP